tara:strand:- start:1873 stop:2169 length:297 start_codon:yes stop_codon:yes gene_type:complete
MKNKTTNIFGHFSYVVYDPDNEPIIKGVYDTAEGACYGAHLSLITNSMPRHGDRITIQRCRQISTASARQELYRYLEEDQAEDSFKDLALTKDEETVA